MCHRRGFAGDGSRRLARFSAGISGGVRIETVYSTMASVGKDLLLTAHEGIYQIETNRLGGGFFALDEQSRVWAGRVRENKTEVGVVMPGEHKGYTWYNSIKQPQASFEIFQGSPGIKVC